MIDVTCKKCRKRFGFAGRMIDCPPCPKCGYQIPKEDLEADDKMMEEFRQQLRDLKHGQ